MQSKEVLEVLTKNPHSFKKSVVFISDIYNKNDIEISENISCITRKLNLSTILITGFPFSFNGLNYQNKYKINIAYAKNILDIVITIQQNFLCSTYLPTMLASEAGRLSNIELKKVEVAINKILLNDKDVLFNYLYNNQNLIYGFGTAKKEVNQNIDIFQKVLEYPLCAGLKQLQKAKFAILSLSGCDNLSTQEVNNIYSSFQNLKPKNAEFIFHKIDKLDNNKITLNLLIGEKQYNKKIKFIE